MLQDDPQILQASFSGDTIISSCTESHRQGQKDRALAMLHQMIEDAHRGKRQFLSGIYFVFLYVSICSCCSIQLTYLLLLIMYFRPFM